MIFKQLPTIISDLNKLGIALKSLDAIKIGTVGVNAANIEAYRTALKGLSVEQSVFALASKGATEEQIRQILVTNQATASEVEAAMAKAGLTTATKSLTQAEMVEMATKNGVAKAEAEALLSKIGITATEEGQVVVKKQVTLAMLEQSVASGTLTKAEASQIAIMLGLNAAETANIGITNLLTASFTKLWAVITAHPIGAILTAIGAIAVGTIAYINKVNKNAEKALVKAHENAEKALEDTKTSLSDDKSELQSINSELEQIKDKIREISSIGTPTLTEQNELNKLSTANAQLETQKSLLENNIKLKQKSAALDAKELLGTQVEMEYSSILDNSSITSSTESYSYADHAKYQASNLKNAYNIYMKALGEGNVRRQELAQELIDASAGNTAELTSKLLEIVESFKYDDGTIIDGYEDIYNEYMGMIYNLQSLTNPDTFLDIAKSITVGTGVDYEKAISEAYALAYEGNFDVDNLNQDFVKALADAGIDKSTIDYIFSLKQKEYQLLVDKINNKYKVSEVPDKINQDYWDANGNIHSKYVDVDEETKNRIEEINTINQSLNDYAKENPVEFQLVTSYDEGFTLLDKYIEEEKSKLESDTDYVGDYILNAIKRVSEEANAIEEKSFDPTIISDKSIDNAKNYQSELKSLYEALNLLRSGIATPTTINELIQKFPELSKHIDDLEGGIEELVEKKLEELRKAFDGAINEEALKRLAEYSVKQEAIADSIKSTTSALNDMTSAYKNVADAMKQYNETGYISLELLESIMAMKPEYLGALLDEWNNMNNAADAYKAYVKVRLAEYEAEAWAESNTNRREALAQYYADGDRIKYDKAVETSIDALAAKLKFVQGIRDNLDKWVSGIGSGSSSSSSSTFDWLEVFLKRIEEKINKVKKVASDTWKSWTDRGKALNSVISETNKELSAQEKAYKTYLDAANKVELSDTLRKRVIEGDPTLPNDKSIDSVTRDKINEFKDLYEKAIAAKDKVDDLRQSLQEYASQRISNISKQFDDQISSIESKKENLDNRITYLNENGISNAIDIYEALIERENEILIENAQKKKTLESELTNYNVGTEAWYELKSKINDVSSAIDESRISLVKFENEIRQAKWDGFDRLIDKINLVIEESDFLTEVLSYDELIDDMGSYTSEGLSTLALHKSNYDVSLAEAKGYTEELKQLRQELADNPANQKLIDRENELQKAQRDTILSAYKEKQAMIDLEKEAIQKQIEAMNKLIDKKKEALNVEKDLYDYQKNLKSKTDNIANLQKQIAVYSQDNSEAGMQKLQSLQKQLSDAQEDLKDTQYDKWVQEQQNMLDELMEEYETVQNEAMNDTDKKFNELCTVIEDNQDRIVEAINNLSNGLVSNNASDNLNDTLMGTSVEDLIGYINDSINEITQAETDKLVEKFNDEVSVPFDNIQSIADSNDKRIELTDDIKNVIISDIPEIKDELTDIDSSIESSSESIVEQLGKVKNVVENCFSVTGTWFSNLGEDLKSLIESNPTATSGKSIAGHSYIMDQILNGGKLITTGGRPIAGLKGYATGLRKSTSNHLAWTQENGLELIYRKYDGAMLTPIGNGDTVFTADMTDNLWNIANNFKPLDVSAIKKQSSNSNSNSVLSIGQLVLPNVKNYEEFRNELVKDNLFKNEIAKSTANKIVTTNKL